MPVRSAMVQKRSLSNITNFMTGSSRRECKEGDVDCVPPLPKCITMLRSTQSGQTNFRRLSTYSVSPRVNFKQCHADTVPAEAIAAAAKRAGGIVVCLEEQLSIQGQAVRGAYKCMYWLAEYIYFSCSILPSQLF